MADPKIVSPSNEATVAFGLLKDLCKNEFEKHAVILLGSHYRSGAEYMVLEFGKDEHTIKIEHLRPLFWK